jgi:hypothetical protein
MSVGAASAGSASLPKSNAPAQERNAVHFRESSVLPAFVASELARVGLRSSRKKRPLRLCECYALVRQPDQTEQAPSPQVFPLTKNLLE